MMSCASPEPPFAIAFDEEEVLVPDVVDREGLAVALLLLGVVGLEADVEE